MCFSATASFAVAAATGAAGILTVARASTLRELPLAGVPFAFAGQQAIEGALWLVLPGTGMIPALLSTAFLAIAFVVWPLLPVLACMMIEPSARRGRWIGGLLTVGMGVAVYLGREMVEHPYLATINRHSLCYANGSYIPVAVLPFYIAATCGPFLLSSYPKMRTLGLLIALGLAITLFVYLFAFLPVWCFFAATASAIIFLHVSARHPTPPGLPIDASPSSE